MAYREHGMWEILDVLKRHHRGESQRRIAAATGRGRKTIRAYIREAKKLGWSKEVPPDEALASRVAQRRQPGPSSSEASASEKALRGHHDRIQQWVEGCEGERGLKLTKVHELLTREGVDVSYSSVYRYAAAHFGWARPKLTLRRAEVSPGELAEVDFGQLGKIYDPESDRNRLVWALLVTPPASRVQASKRLLCTRARKDRMAWPPCSPHRIPDLFMRCVAEFLSEAGRRHRWTGRGGGGTDHFLFWRCAFAGRRRQHEDGL